MYYSCRREDDLDVEVSASGFTRKMQRDLYAEMGIGEDDEEEEDDIKENTLENKNSEIEELRLKVEQICDEEFTGSSQNRTDSDKLPDTIPDHISLPNTSDCVEGINKTSSCTQNNRMSKSENIENEELTKNGTASRHEDTSEQSRFEECTVEERSIEVNNSLSSGDDLCSDDGKNVRVRTFSNTYSMRSTSTASTIAPEVIKTRVKKALEKREKSTLNKRISVKGEASAVTRSRRENRDTIKQCDGIWSWE